MSRSSSLPLDRPGVASPRTFIPGATFLLIAAGVAIPVFGEGRLLVLHALLVFIGPVVLSFALKQRELRALWGVVAVWSAAQLLSDLIHQQPIPSAVLLAGPTIALLVSGLLWLSQHASLSIPAVLAAVGLGWIALEVIVGDAVASGNPWKFGLSTPIAVLVLALAYWKRVSQPTVLLLLAGLAVISVYFDSRNQAAILSIAAVVLVLSRGPRKPTRSTKTLVFLIATAVVAYLLYPAVAASGLLGDRSQQQQATYSEQGSNFLLASRLEMPQLAFLSARHIAIGIGSNSSVSSKEANEALSFLEENIALLTPAQEAYLLNSAAGSPGYNAHSQALATVLFAGFLAIPFWVYLGTLVWRGVRRLGAGPASMPALVLYLSGLTAWDALFSPYATRSHISIAVAVFVIIAVLNVSGRLKPKQIG